MENANYSCSNLISSKRESSTTSDSSCCSLTSAKIVASLGHTIKVNYPHATKHIPRISSNFDGTNEEFVGAAYVNGQISIYDSNQYNFQINCTRNWENLRTSIVASTTRKEFWGDLKCENSASTPLTIEKIWRRTSSTLTTTSLRQGRQKSVMITTITPTQIRRFAIHDETDAYIDEDQQRDSTVLDRGHIKNSNLTANTDATSEPIADSNLRARHKDDGDYSEKGASSVNAPNEIEKIIFGKANNQMIPHHAVVETVISHSISPQSHHFGGLWEYSLFPPSNFCCACAEKRD
ncbi:hypothetical protein K0M31_002252 [Melipona bicolor]|uniref:Uncharacterized protein n=1 Tax=Melipona bicolor TaxID=60889 RepID=A0AA40GH58_9HYME|nr:hypothetical protein K0M31_002252 [Melipona bicolor]